METINLQVRVGHVVNESYDHHEEESSNLLPQTLDDDSPHRRVVTFALRDECEACGFHPEENGEGCPNAITTIKLDNGQTVELPQTLSEEFLNDEVVSFGNHGAVFNLTYEDPQSDVLMEEHDYADEIPEEEDDEICDLITD